jgi:large subunit ribosomal protein L32
MGAHPKQKISKARKGNRRRNQFLTTPQLMSCPMCGQKKRTHFVCPNCGTYKGRQVIDMDRSIRRQRAAEQEAEQ